MSGHSQREIEIKDLKKYLSLKKIPVAEISSVKEDPPDLLLKIDGKRIGVEHSRIINEQQAKRESRFDRLTKACARNLQKGLTVDWTLYGNGPENGKPWTETIRAVINVIDEAVLKGLPQSLHDLDFEHLFIENIWISEQEENNQVARWTRTKHWTVGQLKYSEIKRAIEVKNNKIKTCRQNDDYDEFWLLLVIEGNRRSDRASVEPHDFTFNDDWIFDRVIVLNRAENNFWVGEQDYNK